MPTTQVNVISIPEFCFVDVAFTRFNKITCRNEQEQFTVYTAEALVTLISEQGVMGWSVCQIKFY